MSQKVTTRKGMPNDDKEKRQSDSPVKEMKKKVAANAEKEKQATAADKSTDKSADKTDKNKSAEKPAEKPEKKSTEKPAEKSDKNAAKAVENNDKNVEKDKKTEKAEKKDGEKPKEDTSKGEKSSKTEKPEPKKAETNRAKVNGDTHNGVSDVTLNSHGVNDDALNGTVSADSDDELLVIDDHQDDQDELFPELTYDDTSDVECFEPPTPENAPSRSFTRRSQAKPTRTPETPRPASGRQPDAAGDDSKDSKVLKLKDDSLATDRKLRSSDSPKPDSKKTQDTPKKPEAQNKDENAQDKDEKAQDKDEKAQDNEPKDGNKDDNEKDKVEVEVVIEIDGSEEEQPSAKPDTNYSKSRVKVSPYRRSMRLADQTASSVLANYTGNNTTMEMDITESSFASEDQSVLDDSSYLSGLRTIRGRRSYKPLKEMTLRNLVANRSARSATGLSELPARPTGTVVGRKRKPEHDDVVELATEASDAMEAVHGKRMRLLDRIAHPFRRTLASTPLPRRAAEIVGINTDLPLTAPVASPDTFDPESLKTTVPATTATTPETVASERDPKRCVVM